MHQQFILSAAGWRLVVAYARAVHLHLSVSCCKSSVVCPVHCCSACCFALQALKRSSYDPELFSVLRTEPLPKAAAALAAAGNVAGLTVLLQRHKSTLAPRLLQLLSALPESLDPRMYAALIPGASSGAAAAAAAGPAAYAVAAPRVTKPVGVGNMHAKGLRKVDWVESEETYRFLAAAANGAQSASEARARDSATGVGAVGALAHMASIDAAPGLPIPAVGEEGSSRSGSVGLSSASSLDFSSRALCAEETSVMMHATEELERYCSVNGANKRTLPTDAEVRACCVNGRTGSIAGCVMGRVMERLVLCRAS
jgi:hypothetical protein